MIESLGKLIIRVKIALDRMKWGQAENELAEAYLIGRPKSGKEAEVKQLRKRLTADQ